MSLAAYLAKNYLTADPPSSDASRPKKKRKKNHTADAPSGLLIADDDTDLSLSHSSNPLLNDNDPDAPLVYTTDSRGGRNAEFRKKKSSGWKSIGGSSKEAEISGNKEDNADGAEEANLILRAAAQEQESRRMADEEGEAPTIVDDNDSGRPRMEGGMRAGLQTAAQTQALEDARIAQEATEQKRKKKKTKEEREAQQEETVYRDATGRRIDVHLKRAEARKAEEAARRKEQEEKEKLGGDVQRAEKEKRKVDLDEAKFLKIARYADDEDMNAELRVKSRWGDTMAAYEDKESGGRLSSADAKPIYKGGFQPNRYGIRPGHRWDGVDRGNGFEREWFQARGRKDRNRDLEYQWAMDE